MVWILLMTEHLFLRKKKKDFGMCHPNFKENGLNLINFVK